MKRLVPLIAALFAATLSSAQISYKWTPVPIDSTWDEIKDPAATRAIEKYSSRLAVLQEIIGYSADEYSKEKPESGLSNLAADMIREIASQKSDGKVDIALMNFGGIRTSLPKGAVRVYDIYSIFPFDNSLVYFDIKGSDLRTLLTRMVRSNRIEALSNVKIAVRGGRAVRLEVDGAPLADGRTYRMATINFLMDGGDGLKLRDVAQNYVDTGIWVRDAFVDYFRENFLNRGRTVRLAPDKRVTIENYQTK